LPTFERPANTTSGAAGRGKASALAAPATKRLTDERRLVTSSDAGGGGSASLPGASGSRERVVD
jgi:hypothetical protein